MTDRCEPPEALRDLLGWHWVQCRESAPEIALWFPHDNDRWWVIYGEAMDLGQCGYSYLCPVPPPEIISDLVTALERIAHDPTPGDALIAIAALAAYDPSRRVLNNSPLPVIDTTIKPPAKYYPERQG